MTRRTLILREPLRRRPYGERPVALSHAMRRDRVPVTVAPYVRPVARRGAFH